MNVLLCPVCGSGKTQYQTALFDAEVTAHCTSCDWKGTKKDLVITEVKEESADPQLDAALAISQLYFQQLAKTASKAIGLAIVESSLIGKKDTKSMSRLLRAACLGAHRATLEELAKIQTENANDRK